MRFNTIFQLAFVFELLMMEVACVPKTPVTLLAKPRAELDLASRAGGCPEGMPCKRQKPRISDQYLAQDIGDSSSKDLLAEDEELRLWQRMHDDSATTRGMLDLQHF